jgi:two-component system response regulator HydG
LFHSETLVTLAYPLKDRNFNHNQVKIIVLDDDEDVLLTAKYVLKKAFTQIETLADPLRIEQCLINGPCHVVLLDMNFKPGATSGAEGLKLLQKIKELSPQTEVVIHTAYGEVAVAVMAMKSGAFDFVEKPWEKEKLLATCVAAAKFSLSTIQINQLKNTQKVLHEDREKGLGKILTITPVMRNVLQNIRKVAGTDANVLILGENGTGKELVAREIHRLSARSGESFITVDAAALPPTLIESELFGHVKGAFTDAREERTGRFELASSGTLFLDEIGNLPLPIQSKLLAVLQNRQVVKVGANRPVDIDIRLICATNMPLYDLIEKNEFRQDLLYRINTVEINIPPLRHRLEDMQILLGYFLDKHKKKYMKNHLVISDATINALKQYKWPGNVRELEHATERAVIMCNTSELKPSDFLPEKSSSGNASMSSRSTMNVHEAEQQLIDEVVRKFGGNLTKASKELGMGRTTLYRKLKNSGN